MMKNIFVKSREFLLKVWTYSKSHKIKAFIFLAVVSVAVFYGFKLINKTEAETRYILASAAKGMITTTVSGTGQVAPKEEKTIKAKASGEIIYLNPNITAGAIIAKGTSIATIDTAAAQKNIQEAEENLESAKISLTKLIGADESNPRNRQEAEENLAKSYEDGYNTVSSAFLDLPSVMQGLESILYGETFNKYQDNIDYYAYVAYTYNDKSLQYKDVAVASYQTARDSYDKNFEDYKKSNRFSDTDTVDSLITETYDTAKDVAQAVKDAINLIQFYKDALTAHGIETSSTADTHISSLSSYLNKANNDISSLFNTTSTIRDDKESLENVDSDIRTAKLAVTQKERNLEEAKDALSNCYIYATMGGVISEVNISQGDDVSSGTVAVTIITESKIAKITLSEVDVANIKLGNKAILTFDAVEDLTITGEVTEIDSVGAASSGVVSYGVQIAFDTNDDRIKSGMSVSAAIITESKNDVLTVPTGAVKTQGDTYYVQVLSKEYDLTNKSNSIKGVASSAAPTAKTIEIGLADDTNTEITSGLSEGDQVVVRVSTSSTTSSSTSSSNKSSGTIINTGGMQGGGRPPGM